MRAYLIALCAIAVVVASHAIAQTRSSRAARVCPPDCATSLGYQGYPSGNTPWSSQRPVASGSYGAMLEGRNPASSAGF
ncbi:MAG: hypothetical protein QOH65_443 [Methylobacteriaceae bacterium]|jgi:hypothetical protein|nr:hypothetical protein [Methylobacteriaceae bacterium]